RRRPDARRRRRRGVRQGRAFARARLSGRRRRRPPRPRRGSHGLRLPGRTGRRSRLLVLGPEDGTPLRRPRPRRRRARAPPRRAPIPDILCSMPTHRRREPLHALTLAVLAVAVAAALIAAGGHGGKAASTGSAPSWQGLAGEQRPRVAVGQRMIVLLRAPALS